MDLGIILQEVAMDYAERSLYRRTKLKAVQMKLTMSLDFCRTSLSQFNLKCTTVRFKPTCVDDPNTEGMLGSVMSQEPIKLYG